MQLFLSFENNWRLLKNHIKALLHSWIVKEIKRFNYVKSYVLEDKKIIQNEEKMLLVFFESEKLEKLKEFAKKNNFTIVSEKILS